MKLSTDNQSFQIPQIETGRLALNFFEAADFDAAYQLFNDADVQKYLSPQNKRTREQLKTTLDKLRLRWAERGFGIWCVREKASTNIVGYCGFQYLDKTENVEIVFAFLKEHWRKGFATETANACLRFGFESLRFEKIHAGIHPENAASRHVLKKIGMSFDRTGEHYQMNLTTYIVARDEYKPNEDFYRLTNAGSIAPKIEPAAAATGEKLYFTATFR